MIHVIYRWQIVPGTESEFCAWWHEGTQSIRREQRGSLGSVLLRPHGTTSTFVGVARWQTKEAVEAFWKSAESRSNPYGDLVAVEILDEIDDLDVKVSVPSDP